MNRILLHRTFGIVAIAVSSSALTYGLATRTAPSSSAPPPIAGAKPSAASVDDAARWCREAITADAVVAARAIASLRAAGPIGLEAFEKTHRGDLLQLYFNPACGCAGDSAERRLSDAYDRIAGQRDAVFSNLYWHTDFNAARRASEREGKPILSLRMLGKLTEELSCANSRFFRTTLYADPNVATYLRNNFILHWHSIRPVPKLTIDYGDGRKLERTITGNSAHYVVDRRGRLIDVLPGLYSPQAFRRELDRALEASRSLETTDPRAHAALLAQFHDDRRNSLAMARVEVPVVTMGNSAPGAFSSDLDIPFPKSSFERTASRMVTSAPLPDVPARGASARGEKSKAGMVWTPMQTAAQPIVPVQTAAPIAASKGRAVSPPVAYLPVPDEGPLSAATLERLADRMQSEIQFHPQAIRLIEAKLDAIPGEYLPGPRESIRRTALDNLRRGVAYETARNEYDFHRRAHAYLAQNWEIRDLDRLDDWVYAELFLMPRSDPWAGLLNVDSFSAIDAAGIVVGK